MLNTDEGSVIVRVDFSLGGNNSKSNNSRHDKVVVFDWWFGVFWFEWALIGYFGEVDLSDVESVGGVFESWAFGEGIVPDVVELSGEGVVLLQKHD